MNTTCLEHPVELIEDKTTAIIDELIDSLPDPKQLTSEERRGIIARYSSVLEGNFIYWMTATVIAAKAEAIAAHPAGKPVRGSARLPSADDAQVCDRGQRLPHR